MGVLSFYIASGLSLTSLLTPLLSTALSINLRGFNFPTLIVLTKKLVAEKLNFLDNIVFYIMFLTVLWCSGHRL